MKVYTAFIRDGEIIVELYEFESKLIPEEGNIEIEEGIGKVTDEEI